MFILFYLCLVLFTRGRSRGGSKFSKTPYWIIVNLCTRPSLCVIFELAHEKSMSYDKLHSPQPVFYIPLLTPT